MTRRIALILAATLLVTGLAGCGDDDEATTEDTDGEAPAAAGTFDITGEDFSFDAPDEVEGGVVEVSFANEGTTIHEAVILGVGDTEVDQFLEDFPPVLEGGPFPEYMTAGGGFFEIPAGEERTATQTLAPGDYVVLCTLETNAGEEEEPEEEGEGVAGETERQPHYQRGMVLPFTVTGDEASVDDLPSDSVITAEETSADEYTFDTSEVQAGDEFTFVNAEGNEQIHFALLQEYPEGTTEAEASEALQGSLSSETGEPPPGSPESEDVGGVSLFEPGQGGIGEVTLSSGRVYAALCFIQDRSGGPPHAIGKGMATVFSVS